VRSSAEQCVREVGEGSAPSTDHVQRRGSRLELVRAMHRVSAVDDNHGSMVPADMGTTWEQAYLILMRQEIVGMDVREQPGHFARKAPRIYSIYFFNSYCCVRIPIILSIFTVLSQDRVPPQRSGTSATHGPLVRRSPGPAYEVCAMWQHPWSCSDDMLWSKYLIITFIHLSAH